MYHYNDLDRALVNQRTAQFTDQVDRRLDGRLSEDEFRPLRLMNGLYQELHAYMLRVAIPYGTLSSDQLRRLAQIAETYDRGYGHFTTRQNIQFNWVGLSDAPAILGRLAEVDMHAIQTSGSCIRNVTADPLAGAAADEVEDPRIWCEVIRQWGTLHPEFSFLPRKFKIAVSGGKTDRAMTGVHDIGLRLVRGPDGEVGFRVLAGGGLGRTPIQGQVVRDFLGKRDLLGYLEALLRVYNAYGRRDNKYKARLKILIGEIGIGEFAAAVEAEWAAAKSTAPVIDPVSLAGIVDGFAPPPPLPATSDRAVLDAAAAADPDFADWYAVNVDPHKQAGYRIVTVPLKGAGRAPGDASAAEMQAVADLADRFSHGQVRVTQDQNLVLPHVAATSLPRLWRRLRKLGLAAPVRGLATDITACPGLDYCSLAHARAIPLAKRLTDRFGTPAALREIGPLNIRISGCVNGCAQHHAADIGIRGLDRRGEEAYQIILGGDGAEGGQVGTVIAPSLSGEAVEQAVADLVEHFLALRQDGESFGQAVARLGPTPFKERLHDFDPQR